MLAIDLPADIEDRLATLAEKTGQTTTSFATEAIVEHISDLEALYLAESRLKAYRAGESSATSLEDVMERYGLEG